MAQFCKYCGRQLQDGEFCNCQAAFTNSPQSPYGGQTAGFWESMKNRMGIGDPEINKFDVYERDKRIVPDCVKPNEGEIPVKQYHVANLQNRIFGIPYAKAMGKMQITNKRLIFRAPGRWMIAGRTAIQSEFELEDIGGIEARREYQFRGTDLFGGLIVGLLGGAVISLLIQLICGNGNAVAGRFIMGLLFGIGGCVPFFLLKKKWLLKVLCCGCSCFPLWSTGIVCSTMAKANIFFRTDTSPAWGIILKIFAAISTVIFIAALLLYAIRANLFITVKTKTGKDTVQIRKRGIGINAAYTGYMEVLPAIDAEKCIRELNAIVIDLQKNGDAAIGRWTS